jgi:hypothetical protein
MNCISCNQPTSSSQRARIGDAEGPICDDCAYWSDGNIIADTPAAPRQDPPAH